MPPLGAHVYRKESVKRTLRCIPLENTRSMRYFSFINTACPRRKNKPPSVLSETKAVHAPLLRPIDRSDLRIHHRHPRTPTLEKPEIVSISRRKSTTWLQQRIYSIPYRLALTCEKRL
ncbi:hypothetical protein TSAR_008184 [Trichomalopsis sarcophagae]|uniref:Uncharacterized protein n=1 Tax=Trichomalopsis sarcophagae TaxID=543379 RepID=A0A232FDP2_9HYME|nr:hypothetical protein TSAR_008184 [Trichomalopsis sarcophagae]